MFTGDQNYQYRTWIDNTYMQNTRSCNDWTIGYFQPQQISNNKEQPMEILFNVIVVSKDREILLDEKVVAVDEDEAKFYIDVHSVLKEEKLKPKDVTILAQEIGEVKVRKEVQKVKLVEKEEE